jgi:hypothetical protein
MGASQSDDMEQAMDRHPGFVLWHGQATGSFWAQPPKSHPDQVLLWADSLAALEVMIAAAEGRYGS